MINLAYDPNVIHFGTPANTPHDRTNARAVYEPSGTDVGDAVALRGCACGMNTMLLVQGPMSAERLAAFERMLLGFH